jgi:hypothetical protein
MTSSSAPPILTLCPAVSGHGVSTPGRRVVVDAVSPSFRRDTASHLPAMAGPDTSSEKRAETDAVSDVGSCAGCGTESGLIFLAMEPGPDRQPWRLCGACWRGNPGDRRWDCSADAADPVVPLSPTPVARRRFVAALRAAADRSTREAAEMFDSGSDNGTVRALEQAERLAGLASKISEDS